MDAKIVSDKMFWIQHIIYSDIILTCDIIIYNIHIIMEAYKYIYLYLYRGIPYNLYKWYFDYCVFNIYNIINIYNMSHEFMFDS